MIKRTSKVFILFIVALFLSVGVVVACTQPPVNETTNETVTPSVEPSVEVSNTPEPTVTVEPTVTPVPETKTENHVNVSDGLSSCPECTKAPKPAFVAPMGAPNTGRGL